ncbi:MAG: hypothetical protein AAF802_01850 [Planctomycetota bacterium]
MANHSDPTASSFGGLSPNITLADGAYSDVVMQNGIRLTETAGNSGSVTRSGGEAEREWLAEGDASAIVCRKALFDAGDSNKIADLYRFDDLNLQRVSWERQGPQAWTLRGEYDDSPLVGEITLSISTTGATIRQYQATNERVYPRVISSNVQPATWGQGAINPNIDGEPQGTDIVIPTLKLSISGRIPYELIDWEFEYAKLLANETGKVNSQQMFGKPDGLGGVVANTGFLPGELLFLGATGNLIGGKDPLLTFDFLASPNITGATIAGNIPNVTKRGHEAGWFRFKRDIDQTAGPTDDNAAGGNSKRSIIIVDSYHVSTLYEESTFDALQLNKPRP